MRVECIDNKTFRLTDNEHLLGELAYKNLFSYAVTKNDAEIANLKMNWKGQIVMTFEDEQEFIFKAKGVFHNKYIIENKEGKELILFDPKFSWGKFNYNYEISYESKPQDILFVLLGIYAANYYIAAVAGLV